MLRFVLLYTLIIGTKWQSGNKDGVSRPTMHKIFRVSGSVHTYNTHDYCWSLILTLGPLGIILKFSGSSEFG